jgi:hypothetical protein
MAVGFAKFMIWIKDYWFIIVFIVSFIYTFGQVQWGLEAHAKRDDTQDMRIEKVEEAQYRTQETLAEIKANLQNTNQNTERTLRILEAIQFNPE